MTIILVLDLFVKQNIAATKICCSENLTVDEIRDMWHTNVGSQNHIPFHTQTVTWRYNRVGNCFKTVIMVKMKIPWLIKCELGYLCCSSQR